MKSEQIPCGKCNGCLAFMELPGGCHRSTFNDYCEHPKTAYKLKSKPTNKLNRFKKRMPSFKGMAVFWKPTNCAMCYFWRLALIALIASFHDLGLILSLIFFIVGGYYGLCGNNNLNHKK